MMLIPLLKKSSMPFLKITENPKLSSCILLLAGLCIIVPAAPGAGPARAQSQADPIHIGLNMSVEQAGDGSAQQKVAPRLRSRIRKNPEFAAFAKLLQATSDKKYSTEEIKRLYLDFKNWSQKNNTRSQ